MQVSAVPIKDSEGRVIGTVSINMDITERILAEQTLRDSEGKYQAIFQSAPFSIILSRPADGSIVDVNPAWEELFGVRKEEAVGRSPLELGTIPDPATREAGYAEMRAHGRLRNFEMNFRTKSGKQFQSLNNAEVLNINGTQYLLSTTEDITERRQAEEDLRKNTEALHKSEEKFARSFMSSPVTIAISTIAEGRFIEVNDRYTELFGFRWEELIGQTTIKLGMFASIEER